MLEGVGVVVEHGIFNAGFCCPAPAAALSYAAKAYWVGAYADLVTAIPRPHHVFSPAY
jgi:hypothetical protein